MSKSREQLLIAGVDTRALLIRAQRYGTPKRNLKRIENQIKFSYAQSFLPLWTFTIMHWVLSGFASIIAFRPYGTWQTQFVMLVFGLAIFASNAIIVQQRTKYINFMYEQFLSEGVNSHNIIV